jgi:hypothetical protein
MNLIQTIKGSVNLEQTCIVRIEARFQKQQKAVYSLWGRRKMRLSVNHCQSPGILTISSSFSSIFSGQLFWNGTDQARKGINRLLEFKYQKATYARP